MNAPAPAIDFTALKSRQQTTWSSGDYAIIGTTLQIVGESLCEALDVHAGQRVLDVAAGNGNASLAAARRGCEVTSTDYVAQLLARGRIRAEAEGLTLQLREADAENLPFDNASFDVVTSTFGVMFTPDQERAAAELARVCRPGGKIGLANWTPDGFIGEVFKVIGRYVTPPAGVKSPALWGTEARLRELFGGALGSLQCERRHFVFRYRSAEHWLDTFRRFYGPMHKTFGALEDGMQNALARDLLQLAQRFNRAQDGTLVAPGEYLEVVVTRAPADRRA